MSKSGKAKYDVYINEMTREDIRLRLKMLCVNNRKFSMPESVNINYLKQLLYRDGKACLFVDEILGTIALPYATVGGLDIYGQPLKVRAISYSNSYNKNLVNNEDCVLLYNNTEQLPSYTTVQLYADRLYEIRRTHDVNIKAQKNPVIIPTDENKRLSMENLWLKYAGNESMMIVDKEIGDQPISAVQTQAPFVADKLQIQYNALFNEFLCWVGIENSNQDKKERLVADEVGSNYGNVESSRYLWLNPIEEALDRFNNIFGEDCKVEFNSALNSVANQPFMGDVYSEGVKISE